MLFELSGEYKEAAKSSLVPIVHTIVKQQKQVEGKHVKHLQFNVHNSIG